jgi:ABC-type lipoprotein release transport system permease subunit
MFRFLPWEYGIRNLYRRPLRSGMTLFALSTVILMVLVVLSFVRGLDHTLAASGNPQVALVFSLGMGHNLEYSAVAMQAGDLLAANVPGIEQSYGQKCVSPELYLGTEVLVDGSEQPSLGLVRGVTPAVASVRQCVELERGSWPKPGEILVGRLVAAKLGVASDELRVGDVIELEGRRWRISGVFSATGATFESELWCRLDELQQAMKRQDLSLVAVRLAPSGDFADLDLFCKERLDLELQAMREVDYYAKLQEHYEPVQMLAWLIVLLISGAGVFTGLNTMHGAVLGRVQELSMLRTIGFVRRAIVVSLVQESLVLTAAATLLGSLGALVLVDGMAVRVTMGAVAMHVDGAVLLTGCVIGLSLGTLGAIPPAVRACRLRVSEGLKAI